MKREIKEINIKDIDLDTSQPRQIIDEDKLQELADDMKDAGQIVPILLTPHYKKGDTLVIGKSAIGHKDAKWFVLDGYRRILSAKLNGWNKIDAEIRYELTELDVYETQFRANAKRVQVSVKEMAKAIERYANTWKKSGKKGEITERLSKLTGYSTTYFDMANAIVNEPNKEIKRLVEKDLVGAYYCAEKKASTKDKSIREGMDEAIEEYTQRTNKRVGALTPRVLKPTFQKIEKNVKESKDRKEVAKAKTLEYLNRSIEKLDEKAHFEKYLYETNEFYDSVLKWNIRGLTEKQVEKLTENLMKIVTYLQEEKRKTNKLKTKVRQSNM